MACRSLALLFCVITAASAFAGDSAEPCLGALTTKLNANYDVVVKNSFPHDRGLGEYYDNFGETFRKVLTNPRSGFRWLESGAGHANVPRDYLRLNPEADVQIVGVSFFAPPGAFESPKFIHLGGRLLENITNKELGKFDLITDNFGPYSYTEQIDRVLQKYIDLLNVGGVAYIHGVNIFSGAHIPGPIESLFRSLLPVPTSLSKRRLTIEDHGKKLSVLGWLQTHAGIRVEQIEAWPNDIIRIEKLVEEPQRLGRLKLKSFKRGRPPARKYKVVSNGE